ncbi:MAG: hypothetical protein HQL51_02895 [Magnetococcales bacterium]|nr:hypothetical protein [Magnetococcales bacterium]
MKILVFVEADVVVRHFLHSRAFDHLAAHHDLRFLFPEPGFSRMGAVDAAALELPSPREILPVPKDRLQVWREYFIVGKLRWRPWESPQAKAVRLFNRKNFNWKGQLLYSTLALPGIYALYRAWNRQRLAKMPYVGLEQLLERERPDLLIHPCVLTGGYLNDLTLVSRERGIPLLVIMNSWDNPSTKQSMVGEPDWLLVWGEQTRRHAIDYMGVSPQRVIPFGAAQFELYRHPAAMTRERFCALHGVEAERKLLLYAGSSKGAAEIAHLDHLEAAIESGALPDVTVIYRPHPWGAGGKGGAAILDRPWRHVRIEQTMRGYLEGVRAGTAHEKSLPDYRHTHDTLSSIDALISPLSTIILEGAMHGKPACCFLPDDDSAHLKGEMQMIYFKEMFEMPEIVKAWGIGELVPAAQTLIAQSRDPAFASRLGAAMEPIVHPFNRPYGERLTEFCEQAVERHPDP